MDFSFIWWNPCLIPPLSSYKSYYSESLLYSFWDFAVEKLSRVGGGDQYRLGFGDFPRLLCFK